MGGAVAGDERDEVAWALGVAAFGWAVALPALYVVASLLAYLASPLGPWSRMVWFVDEDYLSHTVCAPSYDETLCHPAAIPPRYVLPRIDPDEGMTRHAPAAGPRG